MESKAEPCDMIHDAKQTARIDIMKANEAGDLELGEEVTFVIKGKVQALRGPEEEMRPVNYDKPDGPKKKHVYPGSISIDVSSFKVQGKSDFDGMIDD